ncbi:hypothetical protein [Gimesia sp.]|uniref:hypothetical protein n=1 Tax=Gimesia sp. TaxID=2024833 RepID=UPI000C6BA449|nr:hypothetical protein [Gimesia sp.]MAX40264.1 hypothetical protein [Gimesia sp.]HAH48641.1 hypothetical protein [Planctomycetaceae bacterium]HBL46505.1 hypothetical protein [Planctomycetaceae bacterium]
MSDLITQSLEVELSIGDTIQIGDQFLTVIDIEESEILFQIDSDCPTGPAADGVKDAYSCF